MAKMMTLVRCMVRINGSLDNVVPPADRGFGVGIVSWPEAELLKHLHGADDCLEGLKRVGYAETTTRDEKARLVRIYGDRAVEEMFPGVAPQMELEMPENAVSASAEADAEAAAVERSAAAPRFVIEEEEAPPLPPDPVGLPPAQATIEEEITADAVMDMPDPAVDGGAAKPARVVRPARAERATAG